MAIVYNENSRTFLLHTKNTTYGMKISRYGNLLHLYYGQRIPDENLDYLIQLHDRGFSPNPNEAGNDRTFSLDFLNQEFSTDGKGDYRSPSIQVVNPDGSRIFSGKVKDHRIFPGKYTLSGMPSLSFQEGEAGESLEIRLLDQESQGEAVLCYCVFEDKDVITRTVRFENHSDKPLRLERLMSMTLDLNAGAYDMITFPGRHLMEREFTRVPVTPGLHAVGSSRGASSHQYNPFFILCEKEASEDQGLCYGVSLIYSGNFLMELEQDQFHKLRLNAGINPKDFSFLIGPGESFQAPEAVLCCSGEGLTGLSHRFHDLFRENLCRLPYVKKDRPVLINSWEAAYFDFDEEKLLKIAGEAKKMGVELFVMDDGWFGSRDSDNAGLGDWKVNLKKIPSGLSGLSEKIHAMGLQFGIWVEPEMVNEDSELYRAHPDWCLKAAGRPMTRGRNQLVLDLSRQEVCDYIVSFMEEMLSEAKIDYVKWDMNRSLSDVWSGALPAERQGEVFHRYVLGLYRVLDQVVLSHPEVLFCGCCGGGGRFDPAMLYYHPQIWCSDNTDAVNRLKIQYGTSFAYPSCCLEAHVSTCPNHQTGREVPLRTREIVAQNGIFGFELDSTKLSEEEKAQCMEQSERYRRNNAKLILSGDYYRLSNPYENLYYNAWSYVSKEKDRALVSLVITEKEGNDAQRFLKLRGLKKEAFYQIEGRQDRFSGALLMQAGLPIPCGLRQYEGISFCLKEV